MAARRAVVQEPPAWAGRALSADQQTAIVMLAEGKADVEVCEALGIPRVTLARWRRFDVLFRAELNRSQQEAWADAADRLRALVPRAVDALSRALQSGEQSAQVALAVLKAAGLKTPGRPDGATDAAGVLDELVRARRSDPMDAYRSGGPSSDGERRELFAELDAELQAEAAAQGEGAGG